MIIKQAINSFLNRKRDDFRAWKRVSPTTIEREWRDPKPYLWRKLNQHQKVCFTIGVDTRRFGFFLDTGMGKTLLSIALAEYFWQRKVVDRVLVLVPNRVNKYEWEDQIREHSPKTPYLILDGSSTNKWQQLRENPRARLVIETYDGLAAMVSPLVTTRSGRRKRKPSSEIVELLVDQFEGLVLDESTEVKNEKTLAHRICRKLAKHCEIVFALTGTPFGRDPTDLWGQLFLIDGGWALGETLGLFRQVFCSQRRNAFGVEWKYRRVMDRVLHRMLAHSSIRFTAEEGDLPRVVELVKKVTLPEDANAYYERARKAIIQARGSFTESKNAFLRMRQISSGFLGYKDDDLGERVEYEFPNKPKLDLLISIVRSIGEEHKIVIYNEFIYSGSMICRELSELGIAHERIYGQTKHPEHARDRFLRDPKCRVLVLANAMTYGLNLQVAKYGIFYESPVRPIVRVQARRRVERQGSKHDRVFLYDLVTKDTVDEKILQFLAEGKDLFGAIIEGNHINWESGPCLSSKTGVQAL